MKKLLSACLPVLALVCLSACEGQMTAGPELVHQKSVMVLNEKAQGYLASGNPDAAVARLESALDLMPNQPETLHNLAIAYQSAKRQEKAIGVFEQLIKTRPDQAASHYQSIGIAYEGIADAALTGEEAQKPGASSRAIEAYRRAMAAYQQAVDASQPVADKVNIEKWRRQIATLEARVKQVNQETP